MILFGIGESESLWNKVSFAVILIVTPAGRTIFKMCELVNLVQSQVAELRHLKVCPP